MTTPLIMVATYVVHHAHHAHHAHHLTFEPVVLMVRRALLIMGQEQIAALHDLRDRAAAAPIHLPEMLARIRTAEGRLAHTAAMRRLSVEIPHGFLVTFSIETGHPVGPCRHLTMSTARENAVPTPETVMMVAQELGFVGGDLSASHIWPDRSCPLHREQGREQVVNLIQPLSVSNAPANA